MHSRSRLVYFYYLRVNFLVKTWTPGRRDQVRLPWQRHTCRSENGCFCSPLQVTYLHTKHEGGLKIFISNFALLSWRIALKKVKGARECGARLAKRVVLSDGKECFYPFKVYCFNSVINQLETFITTSRRFKCVPQNLGSLGIHIFKLLFSLLSNNFRQ